MPRTRRKRSAPAAAPALSPDYLEALFMGAAGEPDEPDPRDLDKEMQDLTRALDAFLDLDELVEEAQRIARETHPDDRQAINRAAEALIEPISTAYRRAMAQVLQRDGVIPAEWCGTLARNRNVPPGLRAHFLPTLVRMINGFHEAMRKFRSN